MEYRKTIKIGETEHTIFMSYALLNQVTQIVGMTEDLSHLYLQPQVQEDVLKALLARHVTDSKKPEDVDLEAIELEIETAQSLIEWSGEHCLDFFLKGLETASNLSKANEGRLTSLMPSETGSTA